MTPQPALPRIERPRNTSRLEEAPFPSGGSTILQQALRRVYRPADELPEDLGRLIDRLR